MDNKDIEQIRAFVMYNYIPFNKMQCVKRLLAIWITSLMLCLVGGPTVPWILILGVFDLFLSAIFLHLALKHSQSQISRYLCDGIFYLYLAVFFNLVFYRLMSLQNGSNWILAGILLVSLALWIFVFGILTIANIKSGKFSKEKPSTKMKSLPYFCGAMGMLTAGLALQGVSEQTALTIVSFIFLLPSFTFGIGSINLLKVLYYKRYM